MNAPIGIGVLGFAHGHVQLYVSVMKEFDRVRLVSAYDDDEERGRFVCEAHGMRYTAHVEDVLGDSRVQAVMVGAETCFHAELCIAAAEAGKHILCQKPMAMTLSECDRMIAASEKNGVVLAMAFQMRHDPANIQIREVVQSGALGTVGVARRRHCIPCLLDPAFITGPTRWHFQADKNIGMFADDAAHPADWLHWTFGKPVSVVAEIDRVLAEVDSDDNGIAVYRFASGMIGEIFNSSTVMAGENTTEIYGDKGMLVQNYGDGPSCSVPRHPDGAALKLFCYGAKDWEVLDVAIPPDQGSRIRDVPRPWVESLLNETPPTATAQDGRVALELILGAYQSTREGRRITFPLDS